MITDEQVETALAYLNDLSGIAMAHFNAMRAKNILREISQRLFLKYNKGNITERTAQAETDDEHLRAQERYEQTILALEETKARIKGAETIIEVWRTYNANARQAEKVR